MKSFTTILLLAVVFFFKSNSSAADALRVTPSPLELGLNCSLYGHDDWVEFYAITNMSLEVSFRNVGENWMRPNDLPLGLSVVWDGKEYKLAHPERFFIYDGPPFQPKSGWGRSFLLSDFAVPPEAVTAGRHTVAVRDEFSETNTFFSWPPMTKPQPITAKSDKQIFAESSTLTVFIKPLR
jgi:hypothetical protein